MPSGSPEPSGQLVQAEIELNFVDTLNPDYECPVCNQVLRYPVQFEECGHHVCSSCLPDLLRVAQKCPIDQVAVNRDRVYVNKQLQKTIQALKVYCSFKDKGCKWQGELKDIPTHVPECDYAPVACPKGCGAMLDKKNLKAHTDKECKKRSVKCEFCTTEVKQEVIMEHYKTCTKFHMECPNKCGEKKIPREELQEHIDKKCSKAGSTCPFGQFGCTFNGEREKLQKHIKEEPTKHLSVLCDGVVELKQLLQGMQVHMEKISSRVDELGMKTECLEKLYGAQLLWRIEGYAAKYDEAKKGTKTTIFSPPFLTGRHGYKMAMSCCLYGDGKVRGTCMSVFICLCQGEYDALLSWPFGHRVTFTLLDQCQDPAGRKNLSYTVKPNTCKENRPFLGRPMGERNASFGAQKFCDLPMLAKLDYIRDDVMFIKVQVDTEDMTPL